jgi:cephalosporin hydroxylase
LDWRILEEVETVVEGVKRLVRSRRFAEAQALCINELPESDLRGSLLRTIAEKSAARDSLSIPNAYHEWYYNNLVWQNVRWLGIPIFKAPTDVWLYQEIIAELRPELIIEFGSYQGGSAAFFSDMQQLLGIDGRVISVDTDLSRVSDVARSRKGITFVEDSSTSDCVKSLLQETINSQKPKRVFAILDSDHSQRHVYEEMCLLRDVLRPADYLVVEDGNVNGHPVLPHWGPGPYEAMEQYSHDFPDDYSRDLATEYKFGFTFATRGFLIRK